MSAVEEVVTETPAVEAIPKRAMTSDLPSLVMVRWERVDGGAR